MHPASSLYPSISPCSHGPSHQFKVLVVPLLDPVIKTPDVLAEVFAQVLLCKPDHLANSDGTGLLRGQQVYIVGV